ncbi:hypothetical protein PGIGA_G00145420 [Pangasianodon gigas]|uniref:Uncharacterized protein n=1 Tax=Pangasianodon gigas TaxID=30993 RepID=A0ACC5XMT1_PANGG|nr:hypothetical protein [Pangasianodon gigas]
MRHFDVSHIRPETSLFQQESSPEVVCHATGFFPKAVMISWQKNGQEVHEDVALRETLPNQDGSFQKRSILKVPAEELQKHTYTCVIQHSSLEKELVLPVSERRILRGGAPIAIIVAVVAALVALVAVVAGIVVWKKKNSVTHSLQYIYTAVTPGINFPEFTAVGQVDGEQFAYYDSNIRKETQKTEWIQKINAEDPDYWSRETQKQQGAQEVYQVNVATLMQRFNQTKGVHTVQLMCGCELDDDGTTRGYMQFGYDGEDFISLDLKTKTWIAPKPQAVITKYKWEATGAQANDMKNYLENTCIEWLKKYVSYGRETLERKDLLTFTHFL